MNVRCTIYGHSSLRLYRRLVLRPPISPLAPLSASRADTFLLEPLKRLPAWTPLLQATETFLYADPAYYASVRGAKR